jgi:hypothetical protein
MCAHTYIVIPVKISGYTYNFGPQIVRKAGGDTEKEIFVRILLYVCAHDVSLASASAQRYYYADYYSYYYYICVRIRLYICMHTTTICVRTRLFTGLGVCPKVLVLLHYVSAYDYIFVCILLLYVCVHTTFHLPRRLPKGTTTLCVRICMFSHTGICVVMPLYLSLCKHTHTNTTIHMLFCPYASIHTQTHQYTCCFHATRTSMNSYFYLKKKLILTSGVRPRPRRKKKRAGSTLPRI